MIFRSQIIFYLLIFCFKGFAQSETDLHQGLSAYSQIKTDQQISEILNRLSFINGSRVANPFAEKINLITKEFLGLPYDFNDPLGEGPEGQYDRDPLYRLDRFDCTTFVETVISLARARSLKHFQILINDIRYEHGVPIFEERNHFTGLEWVPRNVNKKYLIETTSFVASPYETQWAVAWIDKKNWYAKMDTHRVQGFADFGTASAGQSELKLIEQLKQMGQRYSPQLEYVKYISLQTVSDHPEILKNIPSGSVVNIVRPNWNLHDKIGTNLNISHQGIVIHENGKVWLRHASQSAKYITQEELGSYLERMKQVPTIGGIQVLRITSDQEPEG